MAKYSKAEMEKAVLAGIIGVVVMVSVYMFLISPQLTQLHKLKKEMKTQSELWEDKIGLIKKAKLRKNNIVKFEKEIASASLVLPTETGYSWFLELINLWGGSQNIKFDTIVPKESTDSVHIKVAGLDYYSMDMDIALRGGYHQLGSLINQMENYSDSIFIKDISLDLAEDGNENALVSRLTVSLFVLSSAS